MINHEDVKHFLHKNVSYLFTVSLYTHPLGKSLREHIINTYFYFEGRDNEDEFYVLLDNKCADLLEERCWNSTKTKFNEVKKQIIGFKDYEIIDKHIVMTCKLSNYLSIEEVYHIENSNYSNLKEYELYKDFLIDPNPDTIQLAIVEERQDLIELLQEEFKTHVNVSWKKYDKEKETLSLEKLHNMSAKLEINKAWLQNKINNAGIIEKIAYEDVLANSVEVPKINGLIVKSIITENYYELLYKKLQNKLIEKVGKPQYQVNIQGTRYPLLCNSIDFKKKLSKVVTNYKLTDLDKVEKILIEHIGKLKAPLIKYYILKDNESALAGDYESYTESIITESKNNFEL